MPSSEIVFNISDQIGSGHSADMCVTSCLVWMPPEMRRGRNNVTELCLGRHKPVLKFIQHLDRTANTTGLVEKTLGEN